MNPFQQGPPQFSDEIPIEAQAIVMQPEALAMLRNVHGFELLSLFYFQMPFMLKPEYVNNLEKTGKSLVKYTTLSLFAGAVVNVQIKRLPINFLQMSRWFRIPIRLVLMGLPFAFTANKIQNNLDELFRIGTTVQRKKNRLVKNRNLFQYFDVENKNQKKGK